MEPIMSATDLENKCPECGTLNPVGVLICTTCGNMLKGGNGNSTKKFNIAEINAAIERSLDSKPKKILFPPDGILTLRVRERNSTMRFSFDDKRTLIIGRRDKRSPDVPDVDFYDIAGYMLGVSRRHGLFHLMNNGLYIEDVGSSNGTMVNGDRIEPYERVQLYSGVEVRMGQLHYTVHF